MADPTTATRSLGDLAFWTRPATERGQVFDELRRTEPVSKQPLAGPGRGYFWALTRLADVQYVSRTPELFCSGRGVGLGEIPPEMLELNTSFLMMDAPEHTALRRVVSSAFTPRRVAQLDDAITARANLIVDEFVERGSADIVEHLSMKLPLWTISTMVGLPESMQAEFVAAAEAQVAAQDPDFRDEGTNSMKVMLDATTTLHRLAAELVALRRAEPSDDVFSTLVHAEVDGEALSDQLLGGIFVLFAVAGNDTTRTSTSHGVKLLADHADEWRRLEDDRSLVGSAVEEIVRYASPVIHFRRTATADTELAGVPIAEGDPVVVFYEAANRDPEVFDDPWRFDIGRTPNHHVAFGGGGPHFCLGANLARAQLRAVFTRLVERCASIEAGAPDYLTSNFVHGIKRMPVTVTPR